MQHVTRIRIQHVKRIGIQHVMRIRIQHVMRVLLQHVLRIPMAIWFLISALLNPMQPRIEVVVSVKVGVSGFLCHRNSLTALYRIIHIVATQ